MFSVLARLRRAVVAPNWLRSASVSAPISALIGACISAIAVGYFFYSQPKPLKITQDDIDAAVIKTLETQPLPSKTAMAAEKVRSAVVRVRGFTDETEADKESAQEEAAGPKSQPKSGPAGKPEKSERKKSTVAPAQPQFKGLAPKDKPSAKAGESGKSRPLAGGPKPTTPDSPNGAGDDASSPKQIERSVGSGVLISDAGMILTNLHVVAGSKKIMVTFFDGFESEAEVVGLRPENDLAIIKAKKLPDDIEPATMGGSGGLRPGDEVVAVGFPFGMGPSVSAGVVSGLNREFRSPEGKRVLTGLIQFDAAANPGNSGGPLVNMAGEVVGIVTAIFNPSGSRTFIGIGFAVTMEAAGGALGIPPL